MSKDERYDVSQHEGHTPGPWEEGEYIPSDEMIERFQNRELQGAVMQQGSNIMLAMIGLDDNGEKDRQLLAATPEILDALKKAYEREDQLMKVHSDTREWAWEALDWIEGKVKHRDLRTVDAQAFKKWRREFEHFMDGTNTDAPE